MGSRFNDPSRQVSLPALECQNIDNTVSFDDFARIFSEAAEEADAMIVSS